MVLVVYALALFSFRFFASCCRFCVSPTGGIVSYLFCTRVLFHIAANLYRRTANGRPYGSVILERRIIVGASIARPLLAGGAIRSKIGACRLCAIPTGDNGNSLFCTRVLFHIAAVAPRAKLCYNRGDEFFCEALH